MSSQSSFKAKLLTATGDQISKTIKTIDKNDIKNAFTSISSKFKNKPSENEPVIKDPVKDTVVEVRDDINKVKVKDPEAIPKVNGSEEYTALVAQEFNISNLKDNRGVSGNYTSFDYIDYDKDAKTLDDVEESPKNDVDPELGEGSELIGDKIITEVDIIKDDSNKDDESADKRRGSGPKNPNNQSNTDIASFVQKKNAAQGMMDLALLSANTNQLRYVLDMSTLHPYFYTSLGLIITSLALQLCVGLGLLYSNGYNLRRKSEMKSATRWNDVSTVGVFLITLINVFISTFNGSNLSSAEVSSNDTVTIAPNNC